MTAVRRARRIAARVIALVAVSVGASLPASAGTLPAGAEVPAGRSVDLEAFARLVATRYDVQFDRVIAADLDRDGDQDVIGAGDPGVVVWLNDGEGHLTSQPPRETSRADMRAPITVWRERAAGTDQPLPSGTPSFSLPIDRSHPAPARTSQRVTRAVTVVINHEHHGACTPRAPPSAR